MTHHLQTLQSAPRIGFGTWKQTDPGTCVKSVKKALDTGYRHIDTAQIYENENLVGKAIQESGVSRENIFLATKVWNDKLGNADQFKKSVDDSLNRLRVDQVDLLYIHWPAPDQYTPEVDLKALSDLKEAGKTRFIGLSNFTRRQIREARDLLGFYPETIQIEMHPYLSQEDLHSFCVKHDISIVAYSPFRHGTIFDDPVLQDIAESRNTHPACICLAWLLTREHVYPIPKATGDHVVTNFNALDISLSDEEISRIDDLNKNDRYIDPPFGPW